MKEWHESTFKHSVEQSVIQQKLDSKILKKVEKMVSNMNKTKQNQPSVQLTQNRHKNSKQIKIEIMQTVQKNWPLLVSFQISNSSTIVEN